MSWLVRVALLLTSLPVALLLLGSAAQAQTASLRGRVQDGVTGSAIVNAHVVIDDVGNAITNQQGEFRFNSVPLGSHQLRAQALGYASASLRVELHADTTLVITLNPNPVQVDSLRVVTRWVNVTGKLTERSSGRAIMDGAVLASQQRHTRTNAAGRFQFKRVPAGVPFEVHVVAFSYEPILVSLVPERDTTLTFQLVFDTMVQRLIDRQIQRLDVRLERSQGEAMSIPRATLARFDHGTLEDAFREIMQYAPYSARGLAVCFFVDEREFPGNPMEFLIPKEVERIEVLHSGATVRVFTRRFMAEMISSDVKLNQPSATRSPRGFRGTFGAATCR